MRYFVTGGTGFIGRFLVERLLARQGTVYVLVREESEHKLDGLRERLGASPSQIFAVYGDLTDPVLVTDAAGKDLAGTIDHVFHLAAVYDMDMDDDTADRVNVEGTRNVVAFVNALGGTVRLHHVSSVAIAGADYAGVFTEEMFEEGQRLSHPYYRTKFESERIVRDESRVPFRIYRPGMVVGSSETGEMDKIDGPYYFFKRIKTIRDRVPKWLPILGVEGGHMPVAPVDYVAAAIDQINAQVGPEGRVICGLSGGVDSAVAALLVHKAVGDQLTCVFVDHGLLRRDEAAQVVRTFREHFHVPLVHVDAAARFIDRLAGALRRANSGKEFLVELGVFGQPLQFLVEQAETFLRHLIWLHVIDADLARREYEERIREVEMIRRFQQAKASKPRSQARILPYLGELLISFGMWLRAQPHSAST